MKNSIVNFVSPQVDDSKLWINQDAWISLSQPQKNTELDYKINFTGNGVYLFVIEGEVEVGGHTLGRRDAAGLWETEGFKISAKKDSFVLFLDIPMKW